MSVVCFFVAPAPSKAASTDDFITTWKTTSDGETITIPTFGSGYNYDVDWGDASTSSANTGNASHSYATAGTYTVSISGDFPRIFFFMSTSRNKILSVEQWGTGAWTSMQYAFFGASNLVINATDIPNFSAMTDASSMFMETSHMASIPNVNDWDVSTITNMASMFFRSAFNDNIADWDVSNVTNMNNTFGNDTAFNQDISNWNTSSLTIIESMFAGASSFNQDISNWDVSHVSSFVSLFSEATAFNQNLAPWDVSLVTDMRDLFKNTSLSTSNYDAILRSWAGESVQADVTMDGSSIKYCGGWQARAALVADHNWAIGDGGLLNASCTFTEAPSLQAPFPSHTYNMIDPLAVSFVLPEDLLSGSLSLTFTPTSGLPTVLHLRDAASSVTNTFSFNLLGNYLLASEILEVTGPPIHVGTYTVTLAYQDAEGNTAQTDIATNVIIIYPSGTWRFHLFTDENGNGTQDSGEPNGSDLATLTLSDGVLEEDVTTDENGDIDSARFVGDNTLTIHVPSTYLVKGGTSIIPFTITADTITELGSRGIYRKPPTSGSNGTIIYGGGGASSSHGSPHTYSGTSSSESASHSSASASTTTHTSSTIPSPEPHESACLMAGSSSIDFVDIQNNSDLNFLTSLIFHNDTAHHLIHGYADGTFGGNNHLTRFELLKIALGSNCIGSGNSNMFTHTNSQFSDVPQDTSEESRIIGEAFSRGIVTGIGDHFFPDRPVTYAEFIKILFTSSAYFRQGQPLNTLEIHLTNIPDPSFAQPLEYACRLDILPSPFNANAPVTRQAMTQLLARYIQAMRSTVMSS